MWLSSTTDVVASLARAALIWAVALVCVMIYTVGSLRRLAIRDPDARWLHRERQRGRLMRWSFGRLGASFVKIGQVMSSRADVLAPPIIDELRQLQDHVQPFAFRHVRAILERELGAPLTAIVREIDTCPLAAGGIAQVHRCVLQSGEEAAIKVLRPGIVARVRRDARLMLWLAHVLHAISPRARAADVIGHTRSLIAGIVVQTDLRREAENYELFRRCFARSDGIAFPRVFAEHSTRTVLVMEMIHGVHLEHVRSEHVARVTRVLRDAFFAMCFEHGIVHADLHPGNILVRDDGTVVVLDVGLVKYLEPSAIALLVELSRCLVFGSSRDLVAHLRTHHRHAPTTNWDAVAADVDQFMTALRRSSVAELEVSAVVSRLFSLARKHRIHPLPELTLVLLGLVTIDGIAKRLEPGANMMGEVTRYLAPRFAPGPLAHGTAEWVPAT